MQVIKYVFQGHGDDRGQLVALEETKDIPFHIKRVYNVYKTSKDVVRGHCAYRDNDEIMICIHGSCKVRLDDGLFTKEVSLENPYEGLFVPSYLWREIFDFSEDAVLSVLASSLYDERNYVRDYNEFLRLAETARERAW